MKKVFEPSYNNRLRVNGKPTLWAMLLFCLPLFSAPAIALDLDLTTVGGYRPTPKFNLSVSGTHLYLNGWIFDLTNRADPQLIRRYDTSQWPYGLPIAT